MTSEEFRNNPLFMRNQFPSGNLLGMPEIKRSKISLEDIALIGYDKLSDGKTDHIVHFFLDDYKFETIWKDPESHVEKLKKYKAVLSPQFSLYTGMPLIMQAYNTFRNRWCGAFLQSKGIKVIPSVLWGKPESFWFCFDGIPKGSTVAISTLGWRKQKDLFMQGFYELIKRIEPANILCYGDPFDEMQGNVITIDYSQTNNLTKWFKETGKPAQKVTTPTKLSLLKGGGGGSSSGGSTSLSTRGKPNGRSSLYRNGKLIQERYYDENGLAEKDIDYTNHGNPEKHPTVPHEHKWDWTDPLKPIRR